MKRGFILSLLSLVILGIPLSLLAQSPPPTELMTQANRAYEVGEFAQAAALYQSIVDAGFEDGILFYNLGNAYFKQEDWGRAILNYRRAQRIYPRDPDIRDNLTLARAQTVDQIDAQGEAILSRLIRVAQQWLTLNEMAITNLALWFLLVVLIILLARLQNEHLKQTVSYALIVVAILLLGGLFSLGGRLYVETVQSEGVIIIEEVEVMSGPGEQYIPEFTLHTGTEISILEERPRWIRLTLPGEQLQGWVPISAVEVIVGG